MRCVGRSGSLPGCRTVDRRVLDDRHHAQPGGGGLPGGPAARVPPCTPVAAPSAGVSGAPGVAEADGRAGRSRPLSTALSAADAGVAQAGGYWGPDPGALARVRALHLVRRRAQLRPHGGRAWPSRPAAGMASAVCRPGASPWPTGRRTGRAGWSGERPRRPGTGRRRAGGLLGPRPRLGTRTRTGVVDGHRMATDLVSHGLSEHGSPRQRR